MISYKKLFIELDKRKIIKTQLAKDIGISSDTLAKLSKNEPVKMEVLERICEYLNLNIGDIVEFNKINKYSPLVERLIREKDNNISNGIYHETQILLTYNSNHIEGSKLSEDQTRYIFETNTILDDEKNGVLVDDVLETVNHFSCIKFILDHIFDPVSEDLIKGIHKILKTSTSDANKSWFIVGDYKKIENVVGGRETSKPSDVHHDMGKLITNYNNKTEITFEDIIDFHYRFERIHPFQDGNGRVVRLIAFKECLRLGFVPFYIDEEIKMPYYNGLKQYENNKEYLIETCRTGQDKYQKVMKYFGL